MKMARLCFSKTRKYLVQNRETIKFINICVIFYSVLARYLSVLCLAIGCLRSSMAVFEMMLHRVIKWPLELFDTTPQGRIISRFSKDIDTCDIVLPTVFLQFLSTSFSVIDLLYSNSKSRSKENFTNTPNFRTAK